MSKKRITFAQLSSYLDRLCEFNPAGDYFYIRIDKGILRLYFSTRCFPPVPDSIVYASRDYDAFAYYVQTLSSKFVCSYLNASDSNLSF